MSGRCLHLVLELVGWQIGLCLGLALHLRLCTLEHFALEKQRWQRIVSFQNVHVHVSCNQFVSLSPRSHFIQKSVTGSTRDKSIPRSIKLFH